MIPIKTPQEIEIMKEGGKIAATVLQKTLAAAQPGVSTLELDNLAERLIIEAGGRPSFKGFQDYPFATCINVNQGVVHGLPTKRKLKEGDVVTVDLGVFYNGLHTDNARTIQINKKTPKQTLRVATGQAKKQFLDTGRRALGKAIEQCRVGNHVDDISHAIQTTVESAGYNVARELGGHGVGKKLHEPPFIPGSAEIKGKVGTVPTNVVLKGRMVLAVEVIYAQGSDSIEVLNDGWTVVTVDGSIAGLFEETVALSDAGPIILTPLEKFSNGVKLTKA